MGFKCINTKCRLNNNEICTSNRKDIKIGAGEECDTYGCDNCGVRGEWEEQIHWITSDIGICENCYNKLTKEEQSKLSNMEEWKEIEMLFKNKKEVKIMSIEELAVKINQFSKDYDLYGYNDAVENKEVEIQNITLSLINKDNIYLNNIQQLIDEDELTDNLKIEAQEIIKQIDLLI